MTQNIANIMKKVMDTPQNYQYSYHCYQYKKVMILITLYWQQSNANALMVLHRGKFLLSIFNMNRIAQFYSLLYAWDGDLFLIQ